MRITVVTNLLTPYRCVFFDMLRESLECQSGTLRVFAMTDSLPLRPWSFETLKRDYCVLMKGRKVIIKEQDYLDNASVVNDVLSFRPDIIILAGSWTYMTSWRLAFSQRVHRASKLLFWTESHTHTAVGNQSRQNGAVKALKAKIMRRFGGFLVPGEYAKDAVTQIVQDKPFIRLPNLVDNTFYNAVFDERTSLKTSLRAQNHIEMDAFLFFTPARLTEVKGLIPLFDHLTLPDNRKNVVFAIAGEGELKVQIRELAKKKGFNLLLLGYQPQEKVAQWLTMADAFLLPSLSDANPLSHIEAAWSGLPLCVSCYVGNHPELVVDGENGVIFDTLKPESVNEKIAFILTRDERWLKNAGAVSHQRAAEGFDAAKEVSRLTSDLQAFLTGKEANHSDA